MSLVNWMENARAKFCPSSWLVPICRALPSPIIPSHDQVRSGPGEPLPLRLVPDEQGDGADVLVMVST